MFDIDFTTKTLLMAVFVIGAILIFLGTVSGGGFLLGIAIFAIALWLVWILGRRIDRRLVNGSRRKK